VASLKRRLVTVIKHLRFESDAHRQWRRRQSRMTGPGGFPEPPTSLARSKVSGRADRIPRTITLTTFSFDHPPTACYRGCAIMTGEFMYEPVTQRAATATIPGISRHTKLLETRLTQTKQTTEPAISRHKSAAPSHAIRLTGPALPAPLLIGTPKRLETAVTRTKQTTEVTSNRVNFAGVYGINLEAQTQRRRRSEQRPYGRTTTATAKKKLPGVKPAATLTATANAGGQAAIDDLVMRGYNAAGKSNIGG